MLLLQAILHHLEVERREKELLAEEQRNIIEKLKVIEKKQQQYYENSKRAEVCIGICVHKSTRVMKICINKILELS